MLDDQLSLNEFLDAAFELTGEWFMLAFMDGMSAGGAEEEITIEEAGFVAFEVALAQDHLVAFATAIANGVYDEKRSEAFRRADLYGAQLEFIWWNALTFATADQMYMWLIGGTKEHCRDCLAYNGQRHRMSEWRAVGAIPQTWDLECKGVKCQCELRKSPGRPVGVLQPPGAN